MNRIAQSPIVSPGWRSLCALLVLAMLVLPRLGASSEPQAPPENPSGNDREPAKSGQKIFEFLVVGPDAKPIPDMDVEVRSRPPIPAEQVLRGKFLKASNYGCHIKTDAEGRL